MRALLVVNPAATATSPQMRSVIARAFASDVKLDVAETTHRGHAGELATQARLDGLDTVIVLGGDGTVSEVVNGLLADSRGSEDAPALAVVPGGCANVFARALGLPADPIEASSLVLDALGQDRSRTIGLGRADGRYFTFAAGLGLDAAAVHRVELHRAARRGGSARLTSWHYVRAATREFFTSLDRRHPELCLSVAGSAPVPVHLALVCNTRPWSYIGGRPVVACPQASFETGLDVMALRRARVGTTLTSLARMLRTGGSGPRGRSVVAHHDLDTFTLSATRALPFQLDGDYLGERARVEFTAVPAALRVVV